MNLLVLLLLATVDLLPGHTSTWTDGIDTWTGNPYCKEAGMLLQSTSPAIGTVVIVLPPMCPAAGPSSQYPALDDGSPCSEWYVAPTIGACGPGPGSEVPPSMPIATLLGRTGEDIAGGDAEGADGILDVHIRLTQVSSVVTAVRATGSAAGEWNGPPNGKTWIVAIRPTPDPTIVDLYLNYWSDNSSYTLDLTFINGMTRTVITVLGETKPPMPTGFKLQ